MRITQTISKNSKIEGLHSAVERNAKNRCENNCKPNAIQPTPHNLHSRDEYGEVGDANYGNVPFEIFRSL